VLNGLVHLPLILPPVVTGYLLLLTFGIQGPIGRILAEFGIVVAFRWTGAAMAAGIMAFPLMVRAIRLSIEAVDPRLEQAGASLGASRPWVFATVTLPMILPGVIAGAILAFAKAMGEFGATITFVSNIPGQTQTLPSAVYAFLQVRVRAHHEDGLTELDAGGEALFLPRIPHQIGAELRIRIPAQEVILSNQPPAGLSALNVLSGTVETIRAGDGPGAIISMDTSAGIVLARITRRSVAGLGLQPGARCYAVIKTVALAPQDVGGRIGPTG
jgi:molybdopterin-binding protein